MKFLMHTMISLKASMEKLITAWLNKNYINNLRKIKMRTTEGITKTKWYIDSMHSENGFKVNHQKVIMKKLIALIIAIVFSITMKAQSNEQFVGADLIVFNAKIS